MSENITIHCPLPPSTNRIWRSRRGANGKPSFYLDRRYETWKRVFDNIIMATRPRPKVGGPFIAFITLSRDKLPPGSDPDNRIKALFDALQRAEIIENDKLAESITVRKGYAPEGCTVVLSPYRSVTEGREAA